MGFGYGFDMFSIMFSIVFIIVIGMFVVTAIKGIGQWNKNNNSPRLTVPATVVAKRTNVSHHNHAGTNGYHHHSTSTTYYVLCDISGGKRRSYGTSPVRL